MKVLALHEKYGPVVRIAPNELAISHESAWRDIMTGSKELQKWTEYYKVQHHQPMSIMYAPDNEHAAMRRSLAWGFSDRAMRDMEPIIQEYANLLLQRLRQQCVKDQWEGNETGDEGAIDLHAWFNFMSFDLIGDLAFGESYGCLDKGEYHPWVAPLFQVTHMSAVMASLGHYPWLKRTLLWSFGHFIDKQIKTHQAHTRIKLETRMSMSRSDLIEGLLKTDLDTVSWPWFATSESLII